jgi:hypothetical protein
MTTFPTCANSSHDSLSPANARVLQFNDCSKRLAPADELASSSSSLCSGTGRQAYGRRIGSASIGSYDPFELPTAQSLCAGQHSQAGADLVVIAAEHPTLGLVYRRHVDEGAVNAPDEYAITTNLARATTVSSGWRDQADVRLRMGDRFLARVTSYSGSSDERLSGSLLHLQSQTDQSHHEFYCWLHTADWVDVQAPVGFRNPSSLD